MSEKTQDAMKRLEEGLQSLLEADRWIEFLRFQSAFHGYSFHNRLIIWCQNPQATHVAGFHAWKSMGRFVKKGEHGIAILAPCITKKKEKDEMHADPLDNAGELSKGNVFFRTAYVFDVSQTEGEPIPTFPGVLSLSGDTDLYDRLRDLCPFRIVESEDLGGANGSYTYATRDIQILSSRSDVHKAKTLLHEWAHGLLHGEPEGRKVSKEMKELEAESTAYVVGQALGLDTSDYSFGYIATWNGKESLIQLKACGVRIQKAADEILSSLSQFTALQDAV